MRLGIIGLPLSGKTTVFNVLTRGDQPVVTSGGRFEVHTATINVPDSRLEQIAALSNPEKTIFAQVTYADITGLGSSSGGEISGQLLNQLSQMDGLLHVVRCFEDSNVPHISGSIDPQRDIEIMDGELLLNDLLSVERKITRLEDEQRKGGGREKNLIEREITLFKRMQTALSEEQPLRDVEFNNDEEHILAGFGLLTKKPVLVLLNMGEDQPVPQIEYPHSHSAITSLLAQLEMEIAQLPADEGRIFLEEYGITESGMVRIIHLSYDLLGLISFFTTTEDEVRAWTIPRGGSAHEASGMIHSDIYKGFIRAEVIAWDKLVMLGSLAEARATGSLSLEGKDYVLQDGEVMQVRFNI
ncbi:redox-regulated ATPase YchF [Chloroflexota bacterium]